MASNVITAAERIEKKFGGQWEKAGGDILKPPASISTGSLLMDEAIGDCKGYPEGSIVEIFGPQHSGKTLMGYLAIAQSQKQYPTRDHLIIDAENQFRFQSRWAKQVGVNVPELYIKPVTSGEEAFDIIEMAVLGDVQTNKDGEVTKIIKPGNFGIIMVDSVTQLVPLEMIHKGMDDSQRMAAVAALMSRGLKKILSAMVLASSKTIIIFINQTRMDPNAAKFHKNPETRTGGTALPFYDTIALRVAKIRKSEERDSTGKIFAHQASIKFDKNKAGGLPADPIVIRIKYDGTGIDKEAELMSVALMNGLVKEFKRGKYNFAKPDSDDLLDDSIDFFKKDEFSTILDQHSNMKEVIWNYIKKGKFYTTGKIEEDVPDVVESAVEEKKTDKEKTENDASELSKVEVETTGTVRRRKRSNESTGA